MKSTLLLSSVIFFLVPTDTIRHDDKNMPKDKTLDHSEITTQRLIQKNDSLVKNNLELAEELTVKYKKLESENRILKDKIKKSIK